MSFEAHLVRSVAEIGTVGGGVRVILATENHAEELAELAASGDAAVLGAVAPYLIVDREVVDDGLLVLPLRPGEGYAFTCGLRDDPHEIASRMAADTPVSTLLVFVDGLSPHLDRFVSSLDACAAGLAVLGTGVGYRDLSGRPCIVDRDGLSADRALVIGIDRTLRISARHGWRTLHGPLVVTCAENNVLHELNGRPAFEVYREVLRDMEGVEIERDRFFDVAKSYPFGISTFREGEVIIRDPIAANPDGSLTIVSSVAPMDTLYVMKGDREALIDSTNRLASEMFARTTGETAILFDCISRVLFLEDDFGREIDGVLDHVPAGGVSLVGVTSIGEISNVGYDSIKIFNKTTLLGVLDHAR